MDIESELIWYVQPDGYAIVGIVDPSPSLPLRVRMTIRDLLRMKSNKGGSIFGVIVGSLFFVPQIIW